MGKLNKDVRIAVLERDNYTCQKCGQKHGQLTIHHKKSRHMDGTDDIDNLITWCEKCHKIFHIKYGCDY